MNSIVTQRFIKLHDQLRDERRVRSSRQFALSLDYLPQSLSEILKGRRDVTIELLRKAVEIYKANPIFLLTGEGPVFMTEEDHKSFRVLTILANAQEEERIVHVPVPAQSSYAAQVDNPSFIEQLPSFSLPDYKYRIGTHRSFDVAGDSMEPTLFEGDKVICSFLEPALWETSIKDNYVYVIVTSADVLVKRIHNKLKESRQLLVFSDNGFYEPYLISIGDIKEMWYVRAKISPFLPSPQNLKIQLHEEVSELRKTINGQSKLINNLNNTIERLLQQS